MNYNTEFGVHSTDIFNTLLNEYIIEQMDKLDKEFINTFTKEREIENNEVTLSYPNGFFSNPFYSGHKISSIDIHSYPQLLEYYKDNCVCQEAEKRDSSIYFEKYYIDIASSNILTLQVSVATLLETLYNILSIKTEGILFGVIVSIKGKNYNLTHPSVLQKFIISMSSAVSFSPSDKCAIYVYINEDTKDCEVVRARNEKTYWDTDSNGESYQYLNKDEYKETIKKSILFSCALVKSENTKKQKISVSSTVTNYSNYPIYLDKINHSYNDATGILKLGFSGYTPKEINLPYEENNCIDVPYYVPVDILASGVFVPYYGGVMLLAKYNLTSGICNTDFSGLNISPFKSGNIYRGSYSLDFTRVCTGSLHGFDLETMCSINYLNAKSAYHHNTLPVGFLDAIELNIEIAKEILAEYLGKDINENKSNNNETNNTNETQEGSSGESEQTPSGDISVETTVAEPNNPFERDISYSQRVSSPHVEPSAS